MLELNGKAPCAQEPLQGSLPDLYSQCNSSTLIVMVQMKILRNHILLDSSSNVTSVPFIEQDTLLWVEECKEIGSLKSSL